MNVFNISCSKNTNQYLLFIIIIKVRVPVVNIDLAYPEEQWQEIKSTSGDGHVSFTLFFISSMRKCQIAIFFISTRGIFDHWFLVELKL